MCIFCHLHRLSQLLPAMLPWLVIPLLVLWGVSQILPDPWRFEFTPPRVACCVFLVLILVWYEFLMPRLLNWHARRSARLQEQQRTLAIELQKLRKTAVRLCRNCSTPYRDQNPPAGKFMCCYCGHVSKRPIFDLPGPPDKQGFFPHLVGSNGWIGRGPDWRASGNGKWVDSVPQYWLSLKEEVCLTEKSYSRATAFTCKLLSCVFIVVRWLCMKVFKIGSSSEDGGSDASCKGGSKREGEKSFPESKNEKARRKAEEKRMARLEKQMLEEEERKQREEVARLMEEQRKLRDKLETEKGHFSGSIPDRGGVAKKESEKKRHERKREKDRVSNKSTSDGEDIDKKVTRDTERKRESSRKSDRERLDYKKPTVEDNKAQASETGQGTRGMTKKPRYFDRVTGSLLSSSRGLAGANFFGKTAQTPVSKPRNPTTWSTEQVNDVNRVRIHNSPVTRKQTANSNDTTIPSNLQPVLPENTQASSSKKSWLQLFTRTPAVSPSTDTNLENESCQNQNSLVTQITDQYSPHKQLQFESSFPFPMYPVGDGSTNGSLISMASPLKTEALYPFIGVGESFDNCSSELELFEDPCYVPDPVELLGPVSESLDNFPVDVGSDFLVNGKLDDLRPVNSVVNLDVTKLSPVEPPMPRVRIEEKCSVPGGRADIQRSRDSKGPDGSNVRDDHGTWKMWDTPLCQNNLGIVGGSSSWLSSIRDNKLTQEDAHTEVSCNNISPCSMNENYFFSGSQSSLNDKDNNPEKKELHASADTGFSGDAPWLKKTVPKEMFCDDKSQFPPLVCQGNINQSDNIVSPNRYTIGCSLELSSNLWSKEDWTKTDERNGGDTGLARPYVGSLFPGDTHKESVW